MPVGRQSAGANAAQAQQGKIMSQRLGDMESRRNTMAKMREISAALQANAAAQGVDDADRQNMYKTVNALNQQAESLVPYNLNALGQKEFIESQQRGDQNNWSKGQRRRIQDEQTAAELDMQSAAEYDSETYRQMNNANRDTVFQAIDQGIPLQDASGQVIQPLDYMKQMYGQKGEEFYNQYNEYKQDPAKFEQTYGAFDRWKNQMSDYIANDTSIQGTWNQQVNDLYAPIDTEETGWLEDIDGAMKEAKLNRDMATLTELQKQRQQVLDYYAAQREALYNEKVAKVKPLGRRFGDTDLRKATTGQTRSGALYGQGGK